ncbi:MAG: arylsulfatase A-like enzyme [Cognaticolwellia sp.]|jgi:arylsulfatase A-like enzyme
MSKKIQVLFAAGALSLVAVAVGSWVLAPAPSQPTVVLVVLDTVRADHLSVCGYGRRTSPTLEALVANGAQISCGAISPGSWTLPSHASFFTGVMPTEHRAHSISSGIDSFAKGGNRARPLDEKLPTIAERFADQGYQTALVSANPVVSESMGLVRGFQDVDVAERFGHYTNSRWKPTMDLFLDHRDPTAPQFMVINIADAHQPWGAPSADMEWTAEYGRGVSYSKKTREGDYSRYLRGEMDPLRAPRFEEKVTEAYDAGVFMADENLAYFLDKLLLMGFCDTAGCRVVITSDHGEMLGEHGLLDHGHYAYQSNVEVPLIIAQLGGPEGMEWEPVQLPERISGVVVHDLVLTGRLPDPLPPVEVVAWPHARRCSNLDGAAFCNLQAATWDGDQKLFWDQGETTAFDLSQDPNEEAGTTTAASDALSKLARDGKRDGRDDQKMDITVTEMLKAAGYLE